MRKSLLVLSVVTFAVLLFIGQSFAAPTPPSMSHTAQGLNISIEWTSVPGATGYKLYYAPYPYIGADSIGSFDMGGATEASYFLWEGAAYYIAVTAYDGSGAESSYSNIEYFIMGPPTPEWVDDDADGFTEYQGDCDDSDLGISPAAEEICGDGIDQDCIDGDAVCDLEPVEEPTFSPAPATFSGAQEITLETATPGATIYYTTDGSTPSTDSSIYTSPFEISKDLTLKAIAVKDGMGDSTVAAGVYEFYLTAFAPEISPGGGVYDFPQEITIRTTTPDTTIYYTTDGSTPTEDSEVYTEPVEVSASQTIKAIAVKDGLENSVAVSETYTITNQAFAPVFSTNPGVSYTPHTVSLSSKTAAASIYYTTNGATPSSGSTLYRGPFTISTSQTIRAIAYKAGLSPSEITSETYTFKTVAGVWSLRMVTGSNSCGQTVGEETLLGDVTVTQDGANITVSSQLGTESGTLSGNTLNWNMSYPVNNGDINGTLSISMRLSLSNDGNSFSGPVDFTFTGSPLSCNGTGTVFGVRQ